MEEKTIVKLGTMACGTFIACFALSQGHNGYLALVAVVALFGGEKVLEKLIGRNKE